MTSPEKDTKQDQTSDDQTQEPQTDGTDLNDEELDEVSGGRNLASGQPHHIDPVPVPVNITDNWR